MSNSILPSTKVSSNEYEILRLQKDVGSEIIRNIQDVLRDEDINFTEDLSNSFSLVMMGGQAHVGTYNPYARLVDWGLREGTWVNFDALHDWVVIKLGLDDPEAIDVTWKIMKKIQKDGIKPKRFVKKALKRVIGQHGTISIKHTTKRGKKSKGSRIMKTINSVNRTIRKVRKALNMINSTMRKIKSPTYAIKSHIQKKQSTNNRVMRKVIKSERERNR